MYNWGNMRNTLGKNTRRMLLSYLGLLTLAAFFYGGGNYVNKDASYYNFFQNFISDLGRTTSHSGDDNTISIILFSIGMFIQLIAVLIYLVKAADYFSADKSIKSCGISSPVVANGIYFFTNFSSLSNADPAITLHIFFADSVFNGAFVTLGIYAYLFYYKDLKSVTYALLCCSLIILGYIVFLEVGPSPKDSINALTMHATYQKIAVLSLIATIWIMSKGTDLLEN